LNLVLIPIYGVPGAAIASLCGNFLLALLGYMVIPRVAKVSHLFFAKSVVQLIVASGIMGMSVWYINQYYHYGIAILAGAIVYPVMLFVTRAITKEQIKEAILLIKK